MLLALTCAALLSGALQDPVRVTASLSAERINVGGTTTLQVTVETRGAAPEEIRLPGLSRDLEILGTSDYTQTQISVPGGRTRATRREVVIVARSEGVYRIPPVIVRVSGMIYRTAPLDLIVRGGGASGGAGADAASSSLSVSLSRDTVFVGEQVLLRAEATFAEEMRTRQSRPATFDPPAPTGFWVQDLPDPISVTLRVREGRTVETQTYRRAYFPLAAGSYRFPPARLHYEVRRGFLYAPETRELTSDSAAIIVLPVPAEGRPASYTGAVGALSLQASMTPGRIRVGEAAVLTVNLEGFANVKALPEPRLATLPDVEIYPPTQESRIEVQQDRVGGSKRFRWMLVPERPGRLVVPPIEYAVFDPELRTYVVLRTDSLAVDVAPTIMSATGDTALRPLRTRPSGDVLPWVGSPMFAIVQIVPVLLLAGALVLRRRQDRPPGPRDHARELLRRLDQMRAAPADAALIAELEHIALEAVRRVAGVDGDGVAGLHALRRPAAATELETLLRELRRLRFAPAEPFGAQALIDRVRAFIALLEPRRSWRGHAALVLAIVVLPVAWNVAAQSAATSAFVDGVQQYERGDYIGAVHSFSRYASAAPGDPAGWYDLGLAAFRASDRGRAAWAWLRTVKVTPRAADARHNLRAIDAGAALARVQPIDWLSSRERLLAVSAGWWLLLFGIATAVLRRRNHRMSVLPGAVVLIVALALVAWDSAGPVLVTPLGSGTQLYAAPTTRDAALGQLEPGAVAELAERRDDWLRVRTDRGTEAWVERTAVAAP